MARRTPADGPNSVPLGRPRNGNGSNNSNNNHNHNSNNNYNTNNLSFARGNQDYRDRRDYYDNDGGGRYDDRDYERYRDPRDRKREREREPPHYNDNNNNSNMNHNSSYNGKRQKQVQNQQHSQQQQQQQQQQQGVRMNRNATQSQQQSHNHSNTGSNNSSSGRGRQQQVQTQNQNQKQQQQQQQQQKQAARLREIEAQRTRQRAAAAKVVHSSNNSNQTVKRHVKRNIRLVDHFQSVKGIQLGPDNDIGGEGGFTAEDLVKIQNDMIGEDVMAEFKEDQGGIEDQYKNWILSNLDKNFFGMTNESEDDQDQKFFLPITLPLLTTIQQLKDCYMLKSFLLFVSAVGKVDSIIDEDNKTKSKAYLTKYLEHYVKSIPTSAAAKKTAVKGASDTLPSSKLIAELLTLEQKESLESTITASVPSTKKKSDSSISLEQVFLQFKRHLEDSNVGDELSSFLKKNKDYTPFHGSESDLNSSQIPEKELASRDNLIRLLILVDLIANEEVDTTSKVQDMIDLLYLKLMNERRISLKQFSDIKDVFNKSKQDMDQKNIETQNLNYELSQLSREIESTISLDNHVFHIVKIGYRALEDDKKKEEEKPERANVDIEEGEYEEPGETEEDKEDGEDGEEEEEEEDDEEDDDILALSDEAIKQKYDNLESELLKELEARNRLSLKIKELQETLNSLK